MNKKIIKNLIFSIFLLSNTHLKPFDFDPYKDLYEQFNDYVSLQQKDELRLTALWTIGILIIHGINYRYDKYYQEDSLVTNKYPYAQKWYNELSQKYPEAHLDQKQFIQAKYSQAPEFYNIYFLDASLQQIDQLYKKQLAQEKLTEIEDRIIKQNEFLILYQAGYIEQSCALKKTLAITTGFIAADITSTPATQLIRSLSRVDIIPISSVPANNQSGLAFLYNEAFKNEVKCFDYCNAQINIAAALLFILIYLPTIKNYFSNQAYQFACNQCDNDCLQAALILYEKEHDINLVKIIKDQIQHRHNLTE
ncbi:hypothetical protein KBC04_03115 [Candidatus Babeliales bacterium]|nr:hypothetical protein [Candidatus Babeliales bacterium]MBP9843959.1 hypothetical protein [Candidatus Babeliales bacterium]